VLRVPEGIRHGRDRAADHPPKGLGREWSIAIIGAQVRNTAPPSIMKIGGAENRTQQLDVDDFVVHLELQPQLTALFRGSLIEGREGHAEQADAFAGREELAEQSATDSSDLARAPRRHCYGPAACDLLEIGILDFGVIAESSQNRTLSGVE
jgi:hypothetical protein